MAEYQAYGNQWIFQYIIFPGISHRLLLHTYYDCYQISHVAESLVKASFKSTDIARDSASIRVHMYFTFLMHESNILL